MSRAFTVLCLATLGVLPPGGLGTAGAAPPVAITDVLNYAPVVHLHPDEVYLPMRPDRFIEMSRLRWLHNGCPAHDEATPVDASMLGAGGYEHQGKAPGGSGCTHGSRWFKSNELVRPLDSKSVAPDGEGYFLEFDREAHPDGLKGEGTSAPVFYDVQGQWIVYWFFFGYSDNYGKFNHEGDWEGIAVLLGPDNKAQRIVYRQHDGGCAEETDGNYRTEVFTGKGTHASYPNPGEYRYGPGGVGKDQALHTGPKWDARQRLVALRPQDATQAPPWYGFGGAWGRVGHIAGTTGPLGPHPEYKTGVPGTPGPC